MPDANPDVVQPPIQVSPSAVGAQAGSGMRDVLLIVSVLPALVAVLGTKDVVQITAWFAGQEGLAFLGLIGGLAVVGWRQWLARHQHAEKVVMAEAAPNSVAQVTK